MENEVQNQGMSGQSAEDLAHDVMDSLTEAPKEDAPAQDAQENPKDTGDDLPVGVKQRLGRQEKRHQREVRALKEQLAQLSAHLGSRQAEPTLNEPMNPYTNQPIEAGSVEEQIHKAVSYALQQKDMQERKAKEQEKLAYVQKQYQQLHESLDKAADKYDDFEDVVRAPDAHYTDAMRDAALLLPNSADVLYKLGKNKDELKRISQLEAIDQARELVRLSIALATGDQGSKASPSSSPRNLGQIKSNPVVSSSVTDKTSVSELRKRLRNGWK